MTHQEAVEKAKSQSESLKYDVHGNLGFNSKDDLAGFFADKILGVSASAGTEIGLYYDNKGTLTATTQDGKTETINLTGSARTTFESALSKNMTDEERVSVAYNQNIQELQNRINSDGSLDKAMDYISMNKEEVASQFASNTSTGAKSKVENGQDNSGIHTQKRDIEQSQHYGDKEDTRHVNSQLNTIKLNNKGGSVFYDKNMSDEIKSGKISSAKELTQEQRKGIDSNYDKSINKETEGYALESGVQKIENLGMHVYGAVKSVTNNFKGDGSLNEDGFEKKIQKH